MIIHVLVHQLQHVLNLVHKVNLVHNFSKYVYFFSILVSGDYVPIIRRNNCIYATVGTCHSLGMIVLFWYAAKHRIKKKQNNYRI